MLVNIYKENPCDPGFNDPYVVVEYIETEYLNKIVNILEQTGLDNGNIRVGYYIVINGSCSKAAKGINWEIRIEFEFEAKNLVDLFLERVKLHFEKNEEETIEWNDRR